ncbi:MAG: DNA polymerase III subunit gamma/tau [Lachnospiraceae bacterium]|nr:DNA polymerase III subunit gamma/tau [Lachnospiraceae bacterium]
MSYTALYRKFRPDNFNDVKGQDAIVTTLRNQVKSGKTGHAYLFCGTRGTGKTSVAKILAKAVNCISPEDGSPCNKCSVCRAVNTGNSMNVIEIDAASNNGVENVREIVDEVKYSPTEGKYKVYIIDEVHMLSAGAFNALLKTLEEPPSYVIFILATTEVQKIPITILSRCQRYDFKRITVDCIADRLSELMEREGLFAEEKALRYIARMADGALRDALSLLDQCIAFYPDGTLGYEEVLEVLGSVDVEVFARLLRHICGGDVPACISLLDEVMIAGRELVQFAVDFTWYLRNLLLLKVSGEMEGILEVSADQMALLKHESAVAEGETLMRYIRIFSELSNQMKYAAQKRILFEVALIKLCRPAMETDYNSLIDRIRLLEKRLESGEFVERKTAQPEKELKPVPVEAVLKVKETAGAKDLQDIVSNWGEILKRLSPLVRTALIAARPSPGGDNLLLLVFVHELDRKLVEERLDEVKAAVQSVSGRAVEVRTVNDQTEEKDRRGYPDLEKIVKNIPIEYVDE